MNSLVCPHHCLPLCIFVLQMPAYTHSAAFDSGRVAVDDIHQIYYEQYGKRDGKPGTNGYHKGGFTSRLLTTLQ